MLSTLVPSTFIRRVVVTVLAEVVVARSIALVVFPCALIEVLVMGIEATVTLELPLAEFTLILVVVSKGVRALAMHQAVFPVTIILVACITKAHESAAVLLSELPLAFVFVARQRLVCPEAVFFSVAEDTRIFSAVGPGQLSFASNRIAGEHSLIFVSILPRKGTIAMLFTGFEVAIVMSTVFEVHGTLAFGDAS